MTHSLEKLTRKPRVDLDIMREAITFLAVNARNGRIPNGVWERAETKYGYTYLTIRKYMKMVYPELCTRTRSDAGVKRKR